MIASIDTSLIDWSRAQFALTAMYHWLFVPLTLGLGVIQAIMETIYYKTGNEFWKKTAQFWMKLFGINFATGYCIHALAIRIQRAERVAPMIVSQVEAKWKRLLTLSQPKNITVIKVASIKNARIPSIARGAPKMSPTNQL